MIKFIESKNNQLIKEIIKIKNDKNSKFFIIEGNHLIDMAIESNNLISVLLLKENKKIPPNIEQYVVNEQILKKVSDLKTCPGVIGICKKKKETINKENIIIYLDNIKDPGNLGTILRTGLALNFTNFILSKNCVNLYNSKVIMASQGAIFKINFKIDKENKLLNELKVLNYKLISTVLSKDSIKLDDFIFSKNKYCFIFGNESTGIRKELLEMTDYKLYIPISGIDSLNVSIAFGIIIYQIHKLFF